MPPPHPGDVGVDHTQYFGTNYPKPELAGYNKVAPRKAQPPQTKEVKQKSTVTVYSTLNADNHVTGDSSRSRYEDLPTESPTAMHSGEKTSNSVSARNVREMVTTQVSKQVKPLTNQEADRASRLIVVANKGPIIIKYVTSLSESRIKPLRFSRHTQPEITLVSKIQEKSHITSPRTRHQSVLAWNNQRKYYIWAA